jgi:hypothetical protein
MANNPTVGIGKQSAFGAAATTLSAIKVTSVDPTLDIERIDNDEMFGELEQFAPEQGIKQAGISLDGRAYPGMMGHILQMVAGTPATTGSQAPYTHEFTPSDTLPPRYTIGLDESSTGISTKILDALASSFTLTQDMGAPLTWSLEAIATDREAGSVTVTGTVETRAFRFDDLTVTVDSGAVVNFKTLNLTVSNPVENIFTLNGTNEAAAQEFTGRRTIELSGTLRFTNDAASYRAEFEANTSMDLELAWEIDANTSLTIHIPDFRISDHNWSRGFDSTEVDFSGSGYFDSTSGYAIQFTLVNDTATY